MTDGRSAPPAPEQYYDALTDVYLRLFGHDWHLGYWVDASDLAHAATRLNEVMLRRLPQTPGLAILDVGCGAGGGSVFIATRRDCSIVGVSNSRSGLDEATRYAAAHNVADRVRFEFADAVALPFPDASFDAIWSAEAIHNITDMDALCAQFARVLKPGGTIVAGDVFALGDPASSTLAQMTSFGLHVLTADQWIAQFSRHGIRVVESISIGHHVGPSFDACTAICRTALTGTDLSPVARVILTRTIDALAAMKAAFEARELSWGIWVGTR